MIKKVKTIDLKTGVFIHDYQCDYSKENIFLEKSLIKNTKIIDTLLSWGVKEVLIDTERGDDVQGSAPAKRFVPSEDFIEEHKDAIGTNIETSPESFFEEYEAAKEVKEDAVQFINQSIDQIVTGRFPDLDKIYALVKRMQHSIERSYDALSLLTRIRNKDEYTLTHSISVSTFILRMTRFLNFPNEHSLHLAIGALFHDIGKAEIDERILNKPGRLTEQEFAEMKLHAQKSAGVLKDVSELPPEVYDIALHHHESLDGSGYPSGLKGGQISFAAQLTAICDIFDAVTSDRCYRQGLSSVEGLKILYDLRGNHLSDRMTLEFIRSMGVYPVGSCVKLENGLAGIVVAQTDSMLQPFVKIVYDWNRKTRLNSYVLNLAEEDISILSYEDPSSLELSSRALLQKVSNKN